MSHYKIKLDDKAAFLNRLEKQDVRVDSYDITDNKLKGYFEIDVTDEQANIIIKSILKSSPKINTVKEMKQKITKAQLAEIIREEMGKMKGKEKQPVNESVLAAIWQAIQPIIQFISDNATVVQVLTSMALVLGGAGTAAVKSEISRMTKEDPNFSKLPGKEQFKKAIQSIQGSADAATGTNTPGQGIGGNR
jgi:hypothetical protein